jgi:hypothetical protein
VFDVCMYQNASNWNKIEDFYNKMTKNHIYDDPDFQTRKMAIISTVTASFAVCYIILYKAKQC